MALELWVFTSVGWIQLWDCSCARCGRPVHRSSVYRGSGGISQAPPELELFAVFTWLDPPYDPRAVRCVLCVPCGGPGIRNDARTNPAEGLAVLPRIRLPSSRGEPGSGPGSRRSGEVGSGRSSPLPRSRSRSRALSGSRAGSGCRSRSSRPRSCSRTQSGARVSDAAGSDSARRGREFAASVVAVQR